MSLNKNCPPYQIPWAGNIFFFVVFTQKPTNMLVVSVCSFPLFLSQTFVNLFVCLFVFFCRLFLFLFSKRIISDKHHLSANEFFGTSKAFVGMLEKLIFFFSKDPSVETMHPLYALINFLSSNYATFLE